MKGIVSVLCVRGNERESEATRERETEATRERESEGGQHAVSETNKRERVC